MFLLSLLTLIIKYLRFFISANTCSPLGMLTNPLIHSSRLPYHVSSSSYDKENFPLPIDKMWELADNSFKESNEVFPINLVSFVLMSNHYHMLLYTPNGNLVFFMQEFNKVFDLKIKRELGQMNRVFFGRYDWCVVQSNKYLSNCFRYIYQNPVRAGLANRCEDYLYSTLQVCIGNSEFSIPIHDKFGFKDEFGLFWLNEIIQDLELNSMKRSFFKTVFL